MAPPARLFPLVRHLSYRLTPVLAVSSLTPNQITALSLVAGLAAAACFIFGAWAWDVAGGLLLVLSYTLDNCDGEIARIKNMSSKWGARFDDIVDWLVDGAFFAALGYGTWTATGNILWLWLGIAALAGATIDYVVDLAFHARIPADRQAAVREQQARGSKAPQGLVDWLIVVFHKLSRADFCIIVLVLALADAAWILLPLGAVGAQAYWIADLFDRARGWRA